MPKKNHKHPPSSIPPSEEQQDQADRAEQEVGASYAALLARTRKARFLKEFAKRKTVAEAARRIGINRVTVYKWIKEDPEFKDDLTNAQEEIVDMLEKELHKLATGQYSQPVVSAGKYVMDTPIRSESALMALLKAYRPKLYRDRQAIDITSVSSHTEHIQIEKREVSIQLVAEGARHLLESGAVGDTADLSNRALPAAESVDHTLAVVKATRVPKPAA